MDVCESNCIWFVWFPYSASHPGSPHELWNGGNIILEWSTCIKTELCRKDKSVHSKQHCINILQMFPLRGQVEPDCASKAHPTAYQSCQSPHWRVKSSRFSFIMSPVCIYKVCLIKKIKNPNQALKQPQCKCTSLSKKILWLQFYSVKVEKKF